MRSWEVKKIGGHEAQGREGEKFGRLEAPKVRRLQSLKADICKDINIPFVRK